MLRASIRLATLAETIRTVSSVTIEKSARNAGMIAGITPPAVAGITHDADRVPLD